MRHGLRLMLLILFAAACSKNNTGNNNDDVIPVPVKKCHLTSVENNNGIVITRVEYNRPENFDVVKQHAYNSSSIEEAYFKYYRKELAGNKYIYAEYHVFDGGNDYLNGYTKYAINRANNLLIDSSETFGCSNDQCRLTQNPDIESFTKILSEVYIYNPGHKLSKSQVYNAAHQPAGYKMYTYSATGLLLKEEIFDETNTLSQSLAYTYTGAGKDFAFKGEPNQVEKLLFGYARSVQENQLDGYIRSTGEYSIRWIIQRYNSDDLKGYLKSTAMEASPGITNTFFYEVCE
ncbi:MAG: hypothetical protein KF862_21870 [Chitinophagaceae bacterium]|nr:hypothetical protein [Chitinophagaceae bacterium]